MAEPILDASRVVSSIGQGIAAGVAEPATALARTVFEVAIKEKPAGRFMIRSHIRVIKRHPTGKEPAQG